MLHDSPYYLPLTLKASKNPNAGMHNNISLCKTGNQQAPNLQHYQVMLMPKYDISKSRNVHYFKDFFVNVHPNFKTLYSTTMNYIADSVLYLKESRQRF